MTTTPATIRWRTMRPFQQGQTIGQTRSLTNMGLRSDLTYAKGINNVKIGALYEQTLLRENNRLGIVDPAFNAPCLDASGNPVNEYSNPACSVAGYQQNVGQTAGVFAYNPVLAPYDLTRGGSIYSWFGRTDVKQLALYAQDQITMGNWLFNVGLRGDLYNGLAIQRQIEPRVGASYNIKKTNTVLRLSYARAMETPFNENLVLSTNGCYDPVLNGIFTNINPSGIASRPPSIRASATSSTRDCSRRSDGTW